MKMAIGLLIMIGIFLLAGITLVSGASWSAYVFEENGTGIDAVNVTATLANNNYVNSTLTNANGFFNLTITNLQAVKLISSKSGYLTDTTQVWPPINDDRVLPLNITLQQALPGNITGRVTNTSGFGIENVNVSAVQGDSTINATSTDSNGDYFLAYLLDGIYTIEVSALGFVTQNATNVVLLPNSTTSVNFTLDKDTVLPILSDISATLITSSEAVIIWQTDELANSSVSYGTTTSTILSSGSSTLTTSHMVRLSSLSSNTLYYYNVSSCDFAGNCNTSSQFNFTTSEAIVESGGSGGGSGGSGGSGGVATLTTLTKIFGQEGRITFKIDGKIHYLEIIEIANTTVIINISSIPQQAVLSIGEEKKFEINDDEFYDILVRLNGIDNKNANITISYIHEEVPRQPRELLDINLNLLDSSIQDFSGLVVIINFENSRKEQINVKLLFTILNDEGEEVYSEESSIEVTTEKILRKGFEEINIDLDRGKYTFILTILYNINVVNEFRQDFEIVKERRFGITGRAVNFIKSEGNLYWSSVFLVLSLIGLTLYFIRRHMKHLKFRREMGLGGLR